jgi:hypothetical protein
MQLSALAVIAVMLSTILTSFGYIQIKKSHAVARDKKISNYITAEFISGFSLIIIAGIINVGT